MKITKSKPLIVLTLIISGFLTGLTLSFTSLGFIEWFSIMPAACIMIKSAMDKNVKRRSLYAMGFIFFMSYFIAVYSWIISMYPLSFTSLSKVEVILLIIVAWFGLSLLATVSYSLIPVLLSTVARGKIAEHKYSYVYTALIFAGLWAIFEWLQTLHWTGVPWGRLCLGQSNYELILQTSSLFGSYFISFLLVFINAMLAFIVLNINKNKCLIKTSCIIIIAAYTTNLILCICLGAFADKKINDAEKLTFAAIQGNVSSKDKWDSLNGIDITLDIHKKYTKQAVSDGADYVLWSETVIPYTFSEKSYLQDLLVDTVTDCGVTVFIGISTDSTETNIIDNEEIKVTNHYNSIIMIDENGAVSDKVYNKQYLVPFGEYVPIRSLITALFPFLDNISMLEYDLTPGISSTVFELPEARVGALICFDSIYERSSLESTRNGAELLLLSTNDSWFDGSRAGEMHNSQAKLRAIETGRFIVRSANTGISSVISPTGKEKVRLPSQSAGYVIHDVSILSHRTLYSYIGNLFIYLLIGSYLITLSAELMYKYVNRCKKMQTR